MLFLCFPDPHEHREWLKAFTAHYNTPHQRLDSIEHIIEENKVERYASCKGTTLQKNLKMARFRMQMERDKNGGESGEGGEESGEYNENFVDDVDVVDVTDVVIVEVF